MQQQLSEQTFENRQAFIRQNVLAYIDIKQNSPCIVIGLHEHFGLQNYLRLMIQYITNNQQSIVIPSLFTDQGNTEPKGDDLQFLSSLDHSKIAETVYSVCEYAAKSGKKIVLMGFSIGAAIGLKMLQFLDVVDMAFMFYGLPPLEGVQAQLIRAETKIVVGSKDKVKYLSERAMLKQAKQLYESNPKIGVRQVQNAEHGFMNPACSGYSEKHFEQFAAMIQQKIAGLVSRSGVQPQKREQYNGGEQANNNDGVEDSAKQNKQNKQKQQPQQKKEDGCNLI